MKGVILEEGRRGLYNMIYGIYTVLKQFIPLCIQLKRQKPDSRFPSFFCTAAWGTACHSYHRFCSPFGLGTP